MFCKRCGTQLEAQDVFCPECGAANVNGLENTVAAPRDGATVRADYYDEPTVMAGSDATEIAYDLDKTVAAPNLYGSAGSRSQTQVTQPPELKLNYPEPPVSSAPEAKKKSAVPLIVAAFAVVIAVAVAAFVFKEDIIAVFEKETTVSDEAEERERSTESEEETSGYVFASQAVADPFAEATTGNQEAMTAGAIEIPVITQPVIQAPTYAPVTQATTRPQVQASPVSGLNSTDASAVANYYETALKKTSSVEAQRTFLLNGIYSDNSDMELIVEGATILVEELLNQYSTTVYSLPGSGAGTLQASDISSCSAHSSGGYTTVYIQLKSQVDGPDENADTAGPVSRGIGTLGSIDRIAALIGAEITSGKSSVSLTYSDAYIECVIDESTGRIISGEWHYTADVYIGNAGGTVMDMPAVISDVNASVDYTVNY